MVYARSKTDPPEPRIHLHHHPDRAFAEDSGQNLVVPHQVMGHLETGRHRAVSELERVHHLLTTGAGERRVFRRKFFTISVSPFIRKANVLSEQSL